MSIYLIIVFSTAKKLHCIWYCYHLFIASRFSQCYFDFLLMKFFVAGYLITSIGDLTFLWERMVVNKETITSPSYKSKKMLMTLMEPAIEWIMKFIFINGYNKVSIQ